MPVFGVIQSECGENNYQNNSIVFLTQCYLVLQQNFCVCVCQEVRNVRFSENFVNMLNK